MKETGIMGNKFDIKVIGVMISRIRLSRGLSQAKLAEAAGISEKTLSHIENGQSNPKLSTVIALYVAICIILDIETKEFDYFSKNKLS